MVSGKPTYEDLEKKLGDLENEAHQRIKLMEELEAVQQDYSETTQQMEMAIERANQMAAEAEVANLEFSQIFNTVTDAIWVIDKQQKVLRINKAFSTMIQKNESEVIGRQCSEILNNPLCNSPACPMQAVMKTRKSLELDTDICTGNGQTTPFLLTATPFLGFEGKPMGILAIFKDITERKHMEAELQKANRELTRLTVIDGLTQIANRRHFDNTLQKEWNRMSRESDWLSLILCDVDFFKRYNDTNGHQMGDECLKQVALCIAENAKRSGDLAARYGGEEFAVILPGTDSAGAGVVAEKIRQGIENLKIPHVSSAVCPHVTLSLGVTSIKLPEDNASRESLLSLSDEALYLAKEQGRNRWIIKNSG
ncbi:MAG: diguanylate cyclase [Desulfobacteraceae bacterium]|nr:diguanylate cyclase [Desulfobacteraceae bacterium]MBU4052804.1 diguanylate cyclase [Pseudomonadota bacterium]